MDPDDRTFMHELLRRHEKATDAVIAGMHARTELIRREVDAGIEELRRHTKRMDENHRQNIEEFQAQRQALFHILDRLDAGGSAAGA